MRPHRIKPISRFSMAWNGDLLVLLYLNTATYTEQNALHILTNQSQTENQFEIMIHSTKVTFSPFSHSLSLSVLHIFEHICQSVEANWDSMFDAITQNSSDFDVVVVVVVVIVVVFDLKRLTGTRHEYPGVSRLCLHPDCKQLLFVHLIARREICHKVINIVFVLYV